VLSKLIPMVLRLPKELDDKLRIPVKKGRIANKTELIRRALDEFITNHQDLFSQ